MRKFAGLMGLLLLVTLSASAQDNSKVDIFGGYSYLRFSPNAGPDAPTSINFNGGVGSVSYNFTNMIGVVAEVGGYHAGTINVDGMTIPNASINSVSYLFGPKVYKNMGKITPFGQVLFGGVHATPSGSGTSGVAGENGFAMAVGGGLDWNATHRIAVRLGQVEYLLTRFPNTVANGFESGGTGSQNGFRYSAGVVLRF